MTRDLPTPEALAEAPELAILAALDTALAVSAHALIAAHPELLSGDVELDGPEASVTGLLADALLALVSVTRGALTRYRDCVEGGPARHVLVSNSDF